MNSFGEVKILIKLIEYENLFIYLNEFNFFYKHFIFLFNKIFINTFYNYWEKKEKKFVYISYNTNRENEDNSNKYF